jgi:hypothetical protein
MRKLMFPLALLFTCSMAQAADNGFYLGAGVTQAKLDNIGDDFDTGDLDDFKLDNTAWKIIAGFRPVDFFAIEGNYNDLGDEGRTVGGVRFDADAKAFALYAVGFLPIPIVDLYAKQGIVGVILCQPGGEPELRLLDPGFRVRGKKLHAGAIAHGLLRHA